MYSETENAIFTLNRMSFFSDMRKYHLSYYDILHELISIYNLSSHEATLWILKKQTFTIILTFNPRKLCINIL